MAFQQIRNTLSLVLACSIGAIVGCGLRPACRQGGCLEEGPGLLATALEIEYADVTRCQGSSALRTPPPRTLADEPPRQFWDLSLEECLAIALQNSKVLRDLGGRVLTAPEGTPTIYDPAIRESDPVFGPEGALSAFDAQLATSLFWTKNDRALNNFVLGGGVLELQQDLADFRFELSKTAATGTRFALRNVTQYDQNNRTANRFPSAWDTQFEAEVRQPLLQGAGITFNRIAGPNGRPGLNFTTGVLLARINTDMSLADFEIGVRNFVSSVEDAYWELYFAYRDLDAKIRARDAALATWQRINAKRQQGVPGGEAEKETQAQEQYYFFQDQVQDALNGAPGGDSVGVYEGERRLRLLMGLPEVDHRLIRPSDEPTAAKVLYDWQNLLAEALVRRAELRRQQWAIKRRELELISARNFTLPRLDAVAQYRFRGLGDDLTGSGGGRFGSAFRDLGTGDHQEWQMGLELNVPIGYRQAWAGVRHAQLQLAREKAILQEQEKQVATRLADAVGQVHRAYAAVQTNYNRLVAARKRLDATESAYTVDRATLDLLLDAQTRLAQAESRYYRSLVDYAEALKNVHFQKGSLLAYNGVFLSEGPWPAEAYQDAYEVAQRWRPKHINYRLACPGPISAGVYPQRTDEELAAQPETAPPEPAGSRVEPPEPPAAE